MSQLIILLIISVVLLFITTLISKSSITTPQFGFIACFIPGMAYAFPYVEKWSLDLSSTTVVMMLLGMVLFLLVSAISKNLYKNKRINVVKTLQIKKIDNWKIFLLIVIEVASLVLTIIFLTRNYGSDLSSAMFAFRSGGNSITGDEVQLPRMIKLLRRFSLSLGFLTIYMLLKRMLYSKKENRKGLIVCTLFSFINCLTLGARGEAIQLIIAGIMQYLWLYRAKYGNKVINGKAVIKISGLIIFIIIMFSSVGELMGRRMSFLSFNDYIGVYLSAEIKNFDTFVQNGSFGAQLEDMQTLINPINLVGYITGNDDIIHGMDIPFRFVNGHALGNVATTFYPFVYDGGWFGLAFYVSLMAFITQMIYQKSLKTKIKGKIELPVVVYSYVWYTVIFSFFSGKFYEMVVDTVFLWTFLFWLLIDKFLHSNIKFKG